MHVYLHGIFGQKNTCRKEVLYVAGRQGMKTYDMVDGGWFFYFCMEQRKPSRIQCVSENIRSTEAVSLGRRNAHWKVAVLFCLTSVVSIKSDLMQNNVWEYSDMEFF